MEEGEKECLRHARDAFLVLFLSRPRRAVAAAASPPPPAARSLTKGN